MTPPSPIAATRTGALPESFDTEWKEETNGLAAIRLLPSFAVTEEAICKLIASQAAQFALHKVCALLLTSVARLQCVERIEDGIGYGNRLHVVRRPPLHCATVSSGTRSRFAAVLSYVAWIGA
jgi:hypothetical protein